MPPILYTDEGKEICRVLWEETMAEFAFAGVEGIVRDAGKLVEGK